MKTIKKLFRLQTGSLKTFEKKYGTCQGRHFYTLLHSQKCKSNVILLLLHLSSYEANYLLTAAGLPKNEKLIHTVKTN